MWRQREGNRLEDNLITGAVLALTYFLLHQFAPALSSRSDLLIALVAGLVSSAVIYLVKKRKKEKEEEDKLPPV